MYFTQKAASFVSKLQSVAAYNKYGVSPSTLRYCMLNHFSFPSDLRDCLSRYYILRWKASYLLSAISEGTVTREGVTYSVVYKNCGPSQLKKFLGTQDVLLSFREPAPEFADLIYPVVLVTLTVNGD